MAAGPQRPATCGEWRPGRRVGGAGRRGAALGGGRGSAAVVREPGPPRAAASVPVLAALPPRREDGGGRGDGGRAGRRGTGRWGKEREGGGEGTGEGGRARGGGGRSPLPATPRARARVGACLGLYLPEERVCSVAWSRFERTGGIIATFVR